MNVVFSTDFFPRIGGAHLWLYEVYRRWPEPVTVLAGADARDAAAEAELDARDHGALRVVRAALDLVPIDLTSAGSWRRFLGAARRLSGLLGGDGTIHCLRAFPEGIAALLCAALRRRGTRLVVFAHGEEILVARSSRQLTLLARLVYTRADLVIANSESTAGLVRGLAPRARVAVVHPGVDCARYAAAREDIEACRRAWGWPSDTIVVTTVARMEPRKNQAAVIEAIAALRGEGLPMAYVCAGDGEERPRLEALADRLGLGAWVRFTGRLSEADKALTFAAGDVFAMPSVLSGEMLEGFGIVFLEAAAAGVPSVAGNVGGQPEAVLDGRTGLVVDGADLAQVTAALRRLAIDPALRARLGREAAEWAARHDWPAGAAAVAEAVAGLRRGPGTAERTEAADRSQRPRRSAG